MHSRIFVVTTHLEPTKGSIDNLEDLLGFSESDFYDDGGYKPELADYVGDSDNYHGDVEQFGKANNISVSFVSPESLGLIPNKIKEINEFFCQEYDSFFKRQVGVIKIKDLVVRLEKEKADSVAKAKELLNKESDLSTTDRWEIGNVLNPKDGFFFVVGHNESLMNEFDFLDWLETTPEDESNSLYFINSFDYHM